MNEIIIDLNNVSEEEVGQLEQYLKNKNLMWRQHNTSTTEDKYELGDGDINGMIIHNKIFEDELFDYRIINRNRFIIELAGWVKECDIAGNRSDMRLMLNDLKYLMSIYDNYIFSSIHTNEYIDKSKPQFDQLCEELLDINAEVMCDRQ